MYNHQLTTRSTQWRRGFHSCPSTAALPTTPLYDELAFNHDPRVLIAGQLLNLGRQALHEYASKRGFDGDPLVQVLNAAVTAWVDSLGLDRAAVTAVAQQIDDHLGALSI